MGPEVSSLHIQVDSRSALSASEILDRLVAASERAESATDQLAKTSKAAGGDIQRQTSATQGLAKSTEQLAESEAQATDRIRAMVRASVENQRALAASGKATENSSAATERYAAASRRAAQAGTVVAAQNAQMVRSHQALSGALTKSESTASKHVQRLQQELDLLGRNRAETEAYRAKVLGLSAAEQQAAAAIGRKIDQWHINEASAKAAAKAEDKALRGITAHGGQATGIMRALGIESAGVSRELIVIGREAATGNFARIPGSLSVLAQRTNIASLALRLLTNPIVLTGIAATATAAAIFTLTKRSEEMDRAVRLIEVGFTATGHAALASEAQVRAYIDTVDRIPGVARKDAQAIVGELARVPNLSGQLFARSIGMIKDFAALLGVSAPEAAKRLADTLADPIGAAKALDKQFNLLSISQRLQIDNFERQGNSSAALGVLLEALQGRIKGLSNEAITPMQKASDDLSQSWDDMVRSFENTGAIETTKGAIAGLLRGVKGFVQFISENPEALLPFGVGNAAIIGRAFEKQAAAKATASRAARSGTITRPPVAVDASAAAHEAERARIAAENKALLDQTASYRSQAAVLRDLTEQRRKLLVLAKDESLSVKDRADILDRVAAINERLAKTPVQSAFQQKQVELSQDLARAQNELVNVRNEDAKATGNQVATLDAWLATGKNAKKFTEEQTEALRKLAAAIDATDAQINLEAVQKRATTGLQQVNEDLLRATGNAAEASAEQIKRKYEQLLKDLRKLGDTEGILRVENLINIEQARAQLTELQNEIERIFGKQSRSEQTIQLRITSGLISEIDARKEVVDLHRQTADQVDALIPKYEELTAKVGDPKAGDALNNLKLQLVELRQHTNELREAFGQTFEGSVASALEGLATRTQSLGEAARGLLLDIAQGMARFAAEQIAAQAKTALLKQIPGGDTAGALATQAAAGALTVAGGTVSAGATAVAGSATALASAGGTVVTAAGAISFAARELAAAATAATTASTVSSVAGGFSEGGFTGSGGKFEPAGIVHRSEFVTRSEIVREPGALTFLDRFNRIGMRSLRGYADGGLVTAPTLTPPSRARISPNSGAGAGARGHVTGILALEDGLVMKQLDTPGFDDFMLKKVSRNPAKYRSALGL